MSVDNVIPSECVVCLEDETQHVWYDDFLTPHWFAHINT